jgi:hypothetical protein
VAGISVSACAESEGLRLLIKAGIGFIMSAGGLRNPEAPLLLRPMESALLLALVLLVLGIAASVLSTPAQAFVAISAESAQRAGAAEAFRGQLTRTIADDAVLSHRQLHCLVLACPRSAVAPPPFTAAFKLPAFTAPHQVFLLAPVRSAPVLMPSRRNPSLPSLFLRTIRLLI